MIDKLISMDIAAILKSGEYTMLLVRFAKKYILNGGNPSVCTSCLRDYHKKIIMKAELIKKVEARTCVPKFKGRMYIPSVIQDGKTIVLCAHIAAEYLTDEDAVKYLKLGALKESHFTKLPDGFKEKRRPGRKLKTDNTEKAD